MLEAFQKKYSNNTVLRNIDLKINSKEIIGLIGPNGSGKTTFMRIIVGLIKDFEGTIEFNESIKNKGIGCIIESPNFYPYMTGYENLKFFSNILGEFNEKRVKEIIEVLGLTDYIHRKVYKYSLGMRQRLGLVRALSNDPKILILDEPTNGLDVYGINEIRNYLIKIAKEYNISILISSHNLSEIEKICDKVVILQKGEVTNIIDLANNKKHEIFRNYKVITDDYEGVKRILKDLQIEICSEQNTNIIIKTKKDDIPNIIKTLSNENIMLYGIEECTRDLESKFFYKTGGEKMNKVLKLSVLELKKIFKTPIIYIALVLCITAAGMIGNVALQNPESFQVRHVQAFFCNVAEFVIFIYAAKSLGDDYRYGTTTYLFSKSIYSRFQIVLSKFTSILYLSSILGILNGICTTTFNLVAKSDITASGMLQDVFRSIAIFNIYTVCVASFMILITICFSNMIPAIIIYFPVFLIFPQIADMLIVKWENIRGLVEFIPFYIASSVLIFQEIEFKKIIVLLVSGILFLFLSRVIINRVNLK